MGSCMNNVGFSQIDDLTIDPVYNISLIYFNLNQTDFIENGIELDTIVDVTNFTIFDKYPVIRKNLTKLEATININNKFNRNFNVQFDFLDTNNIIVYSFQEFLISANNQTFTQTEVIDIETTPQFLTTKKMKITVILLPSSTPLDPFDMVTLNFQSAGKFYLNF